MAMYRVWAQSISDVYLDVEAESEEEAYEIANEADGGEFVEYSCGGDWILGDIERIDEEEE